MKLVVDTLLTVPDAPPEAGPERALEPAPRRPGAPAAPADGPLATLLPDAGCADVVEFDVAAATESPIAAQATAAAVIHVALLDSNRRTPRWRGCLTLPDVSAASGQNVAGAGQAGPGPELPEVPAGGVWDVGFDRGPSPMFSSWLVCS
ncbi:hypothetical protein ACSMXN_06905 [Jatrophihabitans sp. DSM 45814]